jgi:hypothetical protein
MIPPWRMYSCSRWVSSRRIASKRIPSAPPTSTTNTARRCSRSTSVAQRFLSGAREKGARRGSATDRPLASLVPWGERERTTPGRSWSVVIRASETASMPTGFLTHIDDPLGDMEAVEVTSAIAEMLRSHASPRRPQRSGIDLDAVRRVRALLVDDPTNRHSVQEFERIAGMDRWAIARQFRAAFGTSPTRFRTMRQLDWARQLMRAGRPLSDGGGRVRRPEPLDADVQAGLRADACGVAGGRPFRTRLRWVGCGRGSPG